MFTPRAIYKYSQSLNTLNTLTTLNTLITQYFRYCNKISCTPTIPNYAKIAQMGCVVAEAWDCGAAALPLRLLRL